MNTKPISKLARLTIVAALLAAGVGMSVAGETSTAKGTSSEVIQLHAPNNATTSVAILKPKKATMRDRKATTAKSRAIRLIYLHAPNNATPSITIWIGKQIHGAEPELRRN